MLGFKRFDHAAVTISGIELAEKIKKGQFKTGKFGSCKRSMSEMWNAAARRLTHCEHSRRKNPANLGPDSSLHQSLDAWKQ